MNRYLPHFAYADEHNSPRKCTKACAAAGYKFAGVQFGKECWCGDEVGGQLTADKECFVKVSEAGTSPPTASLLVLAASETEKKTD